MCIKLWNVLNSLCKFCYAIVIHIFLEQLCIASVLKLYEIEIHFPSPAKRRDETSKISFFKLFVYFYFHKEREVTNFSGTNSTVHDLCPRHSRSAETQQMVGK